MLKINTFRRTLSVKMNNKSYKFIYVSWFEHATELVKICLKCVTFLDQYWALTPSGNDIQDLL